MQTEMIQMQTMLAKQYSACTAYNAGFNYKKYVFSSSFRWLPIIPGRTKGPDLPLHC